MDLFELYLLLKGGGGNSANYNSVIQALNEQFGFEFDSSTPLEDVIAAIQDIITFEEEDWRDYTYEDWTSEGGNES